MSRLVWVNRTGKNLPIKRNGQTVGTLYNNEVCIYDEGWGRDGTYNHITYKNSSGGMSTGFIYQYLNGLGKLSPEEK
jgi:hypothetical protein